MSNATEEHLSSDWSYEGLKDMKSEYTPLLKEEIISVARDIAKKDSDGFSEHDIFDALSKKFHHIKSYDLFRIIEDDLKYLSDTSTTELERIVKYTGDDGVERYRFQAATDERQISVQDILGSIEQHNTKKIEAIDRFTVPQKVQDEVRIWIERAQNMKVRKKLNDVLQDFGKVKSLEELKASIHIDHNFGRITDTEYDTLMEMIDDTDTSQKPPEEVGTEDHQDNRAEDGGVKSVDDLFDTPIKSVVEPSDVDIAGDRDTFQESPDIVLPDADTNLGQKLALMRAPKPFDFARTRSNPQKKVEDLNMEELQKNLAEHNKKLIEMKQAAVEQLPVVERDEIAEKLNTARHEYAVAVAKWKQNRGFIQKTAAHLGVDTALSDENKPDSLRKIEKEYIEAKREYAIRMYDRTKTEAAASQNSEEQFKILFKTHLVGLAQEEQTKIHNEIALAIPPGPTRERFNKTMAWVDAQMPKWYKDLPPEKRVAARMAGTTLLLMSVGVATGGIAAGAAVAYGGVRLARAGLGTAAGMGMGKMMDKRFAKKSKKDEENLLNTYANELTGGNFEESEKKLLGAFHEKERIQKRHTAAKIGVQALTTGAVSAASGFAMNEFHIGSGAAQETGNTRGTGGGGRPPSTVGNNPPEMTHKPSPIPENKPQTAMPPVEETPPQPDAPQVSPKVEAPVNNVQTPHTKVETQLSSRGYIATLDDLKHKMESVYKGVPEKDVPPTVKEILHSSGDKLAQKYNLWDPQTQKSAWGLKGESLEVNDKGELVLRHVSGKTEVLVDNTGVVHDIKSSVLNEPHDSAVNRVEIKKIVEPPKVATVVPISDEKVGGSMMDDSYESTESHIEHTEVQSGEGGDDVDTLNSDVHQSENPEVNQDNLTPDGSSKDVLSGEIGTKGIGPRSVGSVNHLDNTPDTSAPASSEVHGETPKITTLSQTSDIIHEGNRDILRVHSQVVGYKSGAGPFTHFQMDPKDFGDTEKEKLFRSIVKVHKELGFQKANGMKYMTHLPFFNNQVEVVVADVGGDKITKVFYNGVEIGTSRNFTPLVMNRQYSGVLGDKVYKKIAERAGVAIKTLSGMPL